MYLDDAIVKAVKSNVLTEVDHWKKLPREQRWEESSYLLGKLSVLRSLEIIDKEEYFSLARNEIIHCL